MGNGHHIRNDDGSGTMKRYKKKSFYWYKHVIETNGLFIQSRRFIKQSFVFLFSRQRYIFLLKKGWFFAGTNPYSFIPSYYCSLNDTGTVYFTRTFLPFCTPGVHFGIELITRIASLSK